MKKLMTLIRVLALVLAAQTSLFAQEASLAPGSETPQVQFMNWAQAEAQKAAQERFDLVLNAIKQMPVASPADQKNQTMVINFLTTNGKDMVHAVRQESNKELTGVVPNTAIVTLDEALTQKMATVKGNAEKMITDNVMAEIKKLEHQAVS